MEFRLKLKWVMEKLWNLEIRAKYYGKIPHFLTMYQCLKNFCKDLDNGLLQFNHGEVMAFCHGNPVFLERLRA